MALSALPHVSALSATLAHADRVGPVHDCCRDLIL